MPYYEPGMVLAVDFFPVTHVGIATEPGWVISNSRARGGVHEEPLHAFSEGRPIRVLGHYGDLPGWHVVERARTRIGHAWNIFSNNCEHFVRWAHGVEVESPQLKAAGGVAFGLAVLGFIAGTVGGSGKGSSRRA